MEIKVIGGSLQESGADTVIANLFEGVTTPAGAAAALDRALGGAIQELIANGDLHGKLGEVGVLYPRGAIAAKRVLVAGLGPEEKLDLETVRRAAAHAIKKARDLGAKQVATSVAGTEAGGLKPAQAAQAVGDGSQLALYKFKAPGKKYLSPNEIESLTLVEADAKKRAEIESGARISAAVCPAVYLARDLVSLPPNVATPSMLAETAEEIAKTYGMKITVGDREWAAERKMGAFLAVAQAAHQPPRFIVMEHNAGRSDLDTIVLVGKGITFDSGGISLKPSEKMEEMKSDMAGAAVVLCTMKVVGMLNLPLHVVAIAPCTENVPGGGSYHPADVLTASNGKTIEIISTDAEGRLILADALVYAGQFKPKAVVDLATLTGACVIALGEWVSAGLFTTDDALRDKLLTSGTRMHERLWPMPLYDDYYKKIVSIVADMANTGGRYGGVGSSAIFLKEFTDYPWAHLDIAGMALITKKLETPYTPWGATGYGVRLLVDFLRNW
jgi:leucyl aminopeptidase